MSCSACLGSGLAFVFYLCLRKDLWFWLWSGNDFGLGECEVVDFVLVSVTTCLSLSETLTNWCSLFLNLRHCTLPNFRSIDDGSDHDLSLLCHLPPVMTGNASFLDKLKLCGWFQDVSPGLVLTSHSSPHCKCLFAHDEGNQLNR